METCTICGENADYLMSLAYVTDDQRSYGGGRELVPMCAEHAQESAESGEYEIEEDLKE